MRKVIQTDYNELQKQQVEKINWYSIVIIGVALIVDFFITMFYENRMIGMGYLRTIAMILILTGNLKLTKLVSYKVTATIYLATLLFGFLVFPMFSIDNRNAENLYLMLFIFIFMSSLPYILFHIHFDKIWIAAWTLVFVFTLTMSIIKIGTSLIESGKDDMIMVFIKLPMIIAAFIISLIFIQYLLYYYRKYNFEQQITLDYSSNKLSTKIDILHTANDKLKEQRLALIEVQKALEQSNNNLEIQIKERTRDLEEQNQEIMRYGFMNSHLLRAPIARLKGLLYLLDQKSDKATKNEIVSLIDNTVNEIDEASKAIDEVLNKKSNNTIQTVEKRIKQLYGSMK